MSPSSFGFVEFALGLLDAFLEIVDTVLARLYLVAQALQAFDPALDGAQLLVDIVELPLVETPGLIQPVLHDRRVVRRIPLRARLFRQPRMFFVESERFLDLGEREAKQITQLLDTLQSLEILGAVLAELPWQARRRLDQPFLLIEAQGRLAQLSAPGDLVDAQQVWRFILLVLFADERFPLSHLTCLAIHWRAVSSFLLFSSPIGHHHSDEGKQRGVAGRTVRKWERIPFDAKLAQRCDSAEYHSIEIRKQCQRSLGCLGDHPLAG